MIKKRIRHLGRSRDIVYAFTRHGFGYVMKELGLLDLLAVPKRIFLEGNKTISSKSTGERIRLFLEDLGPTFIKIGQIASTRPDIIPKEIIEELVKLQDQVSAFPFAEVKKIVETEFADSLENCFASFNEIPIAAASIGQVHDAVLLTGERVAVKIQRPNIDLVIGTDLEILQDLARLAENRLEWARRYQMRDIVNQLAQSLKQELDYENEAQNSEKIAAQCKNDAKVLIPKVYWEYTTSKVLTMEFIEGIKLTHEEMLQQAGYNPKNLAETVVNSILQQILIEGFFHGDPHPGNILALPGEKIAFMDFGIVGRISPEMRDHVASFVIAMMNQNTNDVIRAITKMGLVPESVNLSQLRIDVDHLREKYSNVPFSDMSVGGAVNELFSVAFRHQIKLPTDLTLMGKTLLTIEGVVEKLDPELSIIKIAEPFGKQLILERLSPKNVAERVWTQVNEYGEFINDFPQTLKDITTIMKNGKMKIDLTTPELESFVKKLNRISNRISFSIVLLSFCILMVGVIIGTSLSGQSNELFRDFPVVEIGLVIVTDLFLWLLLAIIRSGRF
ncbi:ABC1 kinase family protein [Neobacillus dielmonensis]|uniref:ABC1 kinase family protein n=1 Tax=Neobacillus dielmonensis TaxID=1347369 RepID=UPI0005A9BFA5|nr:AarF/ABC1/UbiB kinase family protein [Neobacillus dielmonensis]